MGPPQPEFGELVDMRPVVISGPKGVVRLGPVLAFSNGFQIQLAVRLREFDMDTDPFGHRAWGRYAMKGQELPDDLLRIGVQFADGSKVTSLDQFQRMINRTAARDPFEQPIGPVMVPTGGGSGGLWDMGYWVWPVPPPEGNLEVVLEWAANEIPVTRVPLSANAVVEASQASKALW